MYVHKHVLTLFVKPGLDSFINEIAKELESKFTVNLVKTSDIRVIESNMKEADICWFEWCDDLLINASRLPIAHNKKIICRIHSYEVFSSNMRKVNWNVVDRVIFVAEHIRDYALDTTPMLKENQTLIIPNGIKVNRMHFGEREHGFNIAYVGYINYKKGPLLLLHAFKALYDIDSRYKLFIAGVFQDARYQLYFGQMIRELSLENNVILTGWQSDIDSWLEDKQYIISSSVLESQHLSIMEAMAKGIKPLVHNFVGAEKIYPKEYIWNSIDELIKMIQISPYDSLKYREYIQSNYNFEKQIEEIVTLIIDISNEKEIYNVYFEEELSKFYLPNTNDHIQKIIAFYAKFYEESMLADFKNRVSENSVVLDIGSYIGNHTVFFAKHCKCRVIAVEPNILAYNILRENIFLNKLDENVTTYNVGVGESKLSGKIIHANENNMGMSKIEIGEGEIEITTVDNLVDLEERIDCIKIDVEGMELEVLNGAKNTITKHRPLLYIETATNEEFKSVNDFLTNLNYEAIKQFNATPTTLFIYKEDH